MKKIFLSIAQRTRLCTVFRSVVALHKGRCGPAVPRVVARGGVVKRSVVCDLDVSVCD